MARLLHAASALVVVASVSTLARAQDAPGAASRPDTFRDAFVLDDGRLTPQAAEKEGLTVGLHGEYQVRYRLASDLPLQAPASSPAANTLGQNQYLYQWLRLTPRVTYRDKLAIVGQIDLPRGVVVGDTTQFVGAAREPRDEQKFYNVYPRWLYVEYESPIGLFRVGQQGSQWGAGILANDGDHRSMFGDYVGGSIVERLLFATTPMGKGTPLVIAIAGDIVVKDPTADLIDDGDTAYQGVLAAMWRTKHAEIGLYGVVRHQSRKDDSTGDLTPFKDRLTVGVLDAAGRFDAPVAGSRAFIYGQFEAAGVFGATDYVRAAYTQQADPLGPHVDESVRTFGASATLGAVAVTGKGDASWGQLAAEVEGGYASGDGDPYDGTTKRFTFDPNHNVGLVLFKQVMAWKTARSAVNASDPGLVARAAPGADLLPSNGGVFGAAYINPRATYRPRRWLDLKVGVLIAQTTADFVDPYQFGALGSARNYDGGDPKKHDLGLELDGGFEFRVPVDKRLVLQLGAEGGVLFPGHAFDDAAGATMATQAMLNTRAGVQF